MIRRAAVSLVVMGLGLLPMAARAGGLPQVQGRPIAAGATIDAGTSCTIGVDGAVSHVVDLIFPPDDEYFVLIEPAECATCTSWVLSTAHISLDFRMPCSQPVAVRIVEAAPGCGVGGYQPDLGNQICLPFEVELTASEEGIFDFPIPLTQGCRINGPAFLGISFVRDSEQCPGGNEKPRLTLDNSCVPCGAFNYTGSGAPENLCASEGLAGRPIIYAEVSECRTTAALPKSWGSVKVRYR